VVLDEPTTGLDTRSRQSLWDEIRTLAGAGTTVLLTTQYLEEADRLADRIVVIDRGRVIANDTPRALKRSVGGEQIVVTLQRIDDLLPARDAIASVTTVVPAVDPAARELTLPVTDGGDTLTRTMHALATGRIALDDIVVRRPTLDEVFLELTDRPATTGSDTIEKEVA
jgi:ABC-2 type transport system ATP-binding protein